MLVFRQYKKQYNNELVIEIEYLALDAGIYWLLGDNGSGKSTLLKCIGGLIPYKGDISFQGISNKKNNNQFFRKIVNYAEAEPQYPEFLRGKDLIEFYKKTKGATNEQVGYLLDKLEVKPFASGKIGEYSSGMIKKLSLALAFMGNPGLILLDEPLITLDGAATVSILQLIMEYAEKGVSVVLTSHQEFNISNGANLKKLCISNQHLEAIL
jgi:ABC-2 type transport system ATP-binding protein